MLLLICSTEDMRRELRGTVAGRDDVDWRVAHDADRALAAAREVPPDLVLVDRDLPSAEVLVEAIRNDPKTRRTSIVVVARQDFEPIEVQMLDLGANAVLRLPVTPEWDERLLRLMTVPLRRSVRLPVEFEVETRLGKGIETVEGAALDLSVRGLLLECRRPLEVGDDLDLRFRLPDSDAVVAGCGHVVRRAGPHRFGVEFYGLEGDGEERVRLYAEAAGSPGAAGASKG